MANAAERRPDGPSGSPIASGRRLVVLGFGAIGAGLFLYEAQAAGRYARPLVVDVRRDLVAGVRAQGGRFRLNIARADRVDMVEVGPVEVADSTIPEDCAAVVAAMAAADELATALPSVALYQTVAPNSTDRLLAEALRVRTRPEPVIVFCAENHRGASAILEAAVLDRAAGPAERDELRARARFVDTVIGKMSGVISEPAELRERDLATVAPGLPFAFLVEEFDRILVSRVDPDDRLHPGMPALREVPDLAPFEDAKLLGHNATHALAGFLGAQLELGFVADLSAVDGALAFLRTAFIDESGTALRRRWSGAGALFTEAGFVDFADDLLARMVNPHLGDTIERAGRDPRRKLGWDDRLVGLLRLALAEGVPTPRYAMGVVAGLEQLRRGEPDARVAGDAQLLRSCWPAGLPANETQAIEAVVADGRRWFEHWRAAGFAGLPSDRVPGG
jgi:mannitol-1-phosphate 5-dehydrogenase